MILSLPLIIFILLIPVTFAYASWRAAPWVPSFKATVDRFALLADIQPGQTVMDLGCGDGRFLAAAVRHGATAIGFEIALLPYLLAQARRFTLSQDQRQRYHVHFKDFWRTDLSKADIVYVYLLPRVLDRMRQKMETQLKPGTRVIVSTWPVTGWEAKKIDTAPRQIKLYLYQR